MRAKFIPVSRRALVDSALLSLPIDANMVCVLRDIERQLELILSVQAHHFRTTLADLYALYDPDVFQPADPTGDEGRQLFLSRLSRILEAANFEAHTWEPQSRTTAFARLTKPIKVDLSGIETLSVFVRGARHTQNKRRLLFSRNQGQTELVFDHVLVVVSTESSKEHKTLGSNTIHMKLFRNVVSNQIPTILPCVRITMPPLDKLLIGIPAVAGGVPLLTNSLSAIAILFGSISALLGFESFVDGDPTKAAIASLSGLFAVGAYISRQYMKYERRKLKHEKRRADIALFNSLATNAGTIDYIITASIESELKELLLIYIFLIAGKSRNVSALDKEIEAWIKQTFGRDVDFDIHDAERKLVAYGLGNHDDGGLTAFEPNFVKAFLHRRWAEVTHEALHQACSSSSSKTGPA